MSRTRIEVESKDNHYLSQVIDEILNSHNYDFNDKSGEQYWQQGIGVTASPKFIRYYFEGDKVILEGWVKNFGKDSELKGVVGSLPKRSCKQVLDEIVEAIKQANKNAKIPSSTENSQTIDVQTGDEDLTDQLFDYMLNDEKSDTHSGNVSKVSSMASIKKDSKSSNANSQNSTVSDKSANKGIIPRKYRGSKVQNVFEILIAIFYIIGALSGRMVLRFTDSSELLLIVALIILVHGTLSLISNMMDN